MDSCAGELLRYRKSIGADKVFILTDIQKKHWSVDPCYMVIVVKPSLLSALNKLCT